MTLDERARRASRDLHHRVSGLGAEPLPAGFGQPSRRRIQAVLLVFVLVVAVAVPVAVWRANDGDDGSAPRVGTGLDGMTTVGAWSAVPASSAGLGEATAVTDLASTGDALIAVGRVGPATDGEGAIWRSIDALRWERVDLPEPTGPVVAVGADGERLMALAESPSSRLTAMVWTSSDEGRSWQLVAEGDDLFGPPAPEMGRPSVDSVRWVDGGFWVAAGGAAGGYAGVWISPDGVGWTNVELDGNSAGGVTVAKVDGGGYLAYWLSLGWRSTIGEEWVEDPPTLPPPLQLYSVADGADVALVWTIESDATYVTPRALARSADGGRSWTVDDRFLDQHPDAVGETIARLGGVEVIVGWTPVPAEPGTGARGRPGAWASTDGGSTWVEMSEAVREPDQEQWVTLVVAALGDDVVMMSAGRPLDRIYVLDAAALRSAG